MDGARPKIRIYIVEDHDLLRECLISLLELEEGVEVVGNSSDAEHAFRELRNLSTDVVLMDINLPGIDGIEATQRLKQAIPDLQVIILTAHDDDFLGSAVEAGASGYILKTCSSGQLVQAIKAAHGGQAVIDPSLTSKLFNEVVGLRKAHRESLLTSRQIEVMKLVANGTRYRDIAKATYLSTTTVNREMREVFNRLGVNDAAHAVAEVYKRGIL